MHGRVSLVGIGFVIVDDLNTCGDVLLQADYEQAMDVLRTGMRSKPGPIGMSRLYMVEAEMESLKGNWVCVTAHACA